MRKAYYIKSDAFPVEFMGTSTAFWTSKGKVGGNQGKGMVGGNQGKGMVGGNQGKGMVGD